MLTDRKEIEAKIKKHMSYQFMDQHIHAKELPEEKIWLLTELMNQLGLSAKTQEEIIVPCVLVEVALDVHDTVSLYEESEEPSLTSQLSVLAGDYYSGLYYSLLSQSGRVELIDALAKAIKQINELKMELYLTDYITIEVSLEHIKRMNAIIILTVLDYLHLDDYRNTHEESMINWLFYQKIERDLCKQNHDKTGLNLYDKWFCHRTDLTKEQYIQKISELVSMYKAEFENGNDWLQA